MKSFRTSADSTDPWDLYQASVQDSTAQARVLEHLFRRIVVSVTGDNEEPR